MPTAAINGNVIPFRRRKRALTGPRALALLRKNETIEVSSLAALGELFGWDRSRARKTVLAWEKARHATVERSADGGIIVRALPVDPVALRAFGPGENRERVRRRKPADARPKQRAQTRVRGQKAGADDGENTSAERVASTAPKRVAKDVENGGSAGGENKSEFGGAPNIYAGTTAPGNAPNGAPEHARVSDLQYLQKRAPVTVAEAPAETRVSEGYHEVPTGRTDDHVPTRSDTRLPWRRQGGGGGPVEVNQRVGVWTLIAALIMAGFSTFLTVLGFTVLLPGWPLLSMGLGAATEFGRLVVVGKATHGWRELNGLLRLGAVLYIVLAESVSLIGVYSELHNLHTGNRPEATAAVEMSKAETAAKVDYQKSVIADLDTQIANVDRNSGALVAADAKRGRVKDGKSLIGASDKQRAPLVEQRKQAAGQLAALQGEAARATGRGAMLEAEVSQVKQVAALLNIDAGDALRWWLLAITVLIGPCASLLIAMAFHRGRAA
jgi:hypothetical protein